MIPKLDDEHVVMVRQFRHPCRRTFLELPAGTAHAGEPLEVTAARELAEETGYKAARMDRVFEMFPLPGAANEKMAFFRCQGLVPGPMQLELDEDLAVQVMTLNDALAAIDAGEICDGKSIIGLWLEAKLMGITQRRG
jgi:ADP-ribose pyrophosphatase